MASDNLQDWKFKMAKKRVKKIKGFYQHLGSWAACSAFFILLNFVTESQEFWAIYPILGWGLGVALHAIGVFGFPGKNSRWEEQMIEAEMHRIEMEEYYRQKQNSPAQLPSHGALSEEGLELKEVRKEWRDSDLV